MRIVNEALLRDFARQQHCEWCKRLNRAGLDPHHLFARGMGGGNRLDIRCNLIALCRECHTNLHAGNILRCDLIAIVAKREKMTQDEILERIAYLRQLPKERIHEIECEGR